MFNIFNLFNDKKNNFETNLNARKLRDLELIPTFKLNQEVKDEFERIKNRLLLGEKLIVVNDEDYSQQFFFNDGKDYLDESHDYFCNRVAILEVKSDDEIIVNDIPSLNSV